ncbi:NAD-P-binding protein [Ceratobasidium sp. AG-I]|nr:NAD-P-binding protein [Ceratobasidium sp. AG-I]
MSVTRYMVVGANRGIGLEFVRQLLQNNSNHIVATYRDPNKIDQLQVLLSDLDNAGRLHLARLDMNDAQSCKEVAEDVKAKHGVIDVLIVNAGVYVKGPLLNLDPKELTSILDNNILGPLRICQAFVPLLKNDTSAGNDAVSKLLLLSSDMSSLKLANHGNDPAYSMSKAGLNMMGRKFAYELEPSKIAVGLLHPGWVQTDMGGENAPVTPKDSVSGMLKVIDRLDATNTGGFWDYTGETHPW